MQLKSKERLFASLVHPGHFEPDLHWYPKALNATIHPMVNFFLNLEKHRIINRYCHLHPKVDQHALEKILSYQPKVFKWAGADLINVTTAEGQRQMVVIENNSCPSGQKSMPLTDDHKVMGGYQLLLERTFLAQLKQRRSGVKEGGLAVIYDKNPMEASGYAAALAHLSGEKVYYAAFHDRDKNPPVRFEQGVMELRAEDGLWHPIRAAFRYVTQKPWNRIPIDTKTLILNPVLACLAGGRNKMVAAKAYEFYNAELAPSGMQINIPETIWDVSKQEIPLWVRRLGGQAVVKVPYSNAGQGVYTITSDHEMQEFMHMEFNYDQFIVQSLIGNYRWSSNTSKGRLYHVGTVPNERGNSFVADIRMMVSSTQDGIRPLCVYSRRAAKPLLDKLSSDTDSWGMLGTNLSIKREDGGWDSDTNRLILMDRRDFNRLGLGLDDLIEGYIQTVLSMVAIDRMCINLMNSKGKFRMKLFRSLNPDEQLLDEIM